MSDQQSYGEFNAQDIGRYLKGEMSPEEMNRFEKAALEDPFLAEAIEGYEINPVVNISEDIHELSERLAERTVAREKSIYGWRRIAAMLVLILGASLVTWFLNRPQSVIQTLAKNEELRPVPGKDGIIDSSHQLLPAKGSNSVKSTEMSNRNINPSDTAAGIAAANANDNIIELNQSEANPVTKAAGAKSDSLANQKAILITESPKIQANTKEAGGRPGIVPSNADIAAPEEKARPSGLSPAKESAPETRKSGPYKNEAANRSVASGQAGSIPTHYFRGKVIDQGNKPVPYAKVRISNTNKSTYTDVNGYFSIVASDTVLKADIMSVGFIGKKTDLSASAEPVIIRLETSTSALSEVVVTGMDKKQHDNQEKMDSNAEHKLNPFAEPEDGWSLFEIYLRNNLRIPATPSSQPLKGIVTLSFFVDPDSGKLYDFKIEKSMGTLYDKEAIRVLKEGPSWDVFNSPGRVRATYTVVF